MPQSKSPAFAHLDPSCAPAEIRGICTHLLCQVRVSGYISRAWKRAGPICFVEFAHLDPSRVPGRSRGREEVSLLEVSRPVLHRQLRFLQLRTLCPHHRAWGTPYPCKHGSLPPCSTGLGCSYSSHPSQGTRAGPLLVRVRNSYIWRAAGCAAPNSQCSSLCTLRSALSAHCCITIL